jgi:5-methylcytosine-specific restriction endonuclease McrA
MLSRSEPHHTDKERAACRANDDQPDTTLGSPIRTRRRMRRQCIRSTPSSGGARCAVIARDGWRCRICDGLAPTADHLVPRERGVAYSMDNSIACCNACNRIAAGGRGEIRKQENVDYAFPGDPA